MRIAFEDVVLRDYLESDIADDIRWMNEQTDWQRADTPWDNPEPIDPEEYRECMLMNTDIPEDIVRFRFEIEYEGKHIGFVSSYFLDENYEFMPFEEITEDSKLTRTLGIEICEPEFWNRSIGKKALTAFILYYLGSGESEFCLETHSGNPRMVKCAERLGFSVCKTVADAHEFEGTHYDSLTFRFDPEKFSKYANE